MWLIAGLGNPGKRYAYTRHNTGFRVIDHISLKYSIVFCHYTGYDYGIGIIRLASVALLKPLTFMNRSGHAVRHALLRFGLSPERLIVVQDDIDLEAGSVKIRKNGSSGGHRGIQSLLDNLGTKVFLRVKVGIGRDREMPADEYVLGRFSPEEEELTGNAVLRAEDAICTIVNSGPEKAMNIFNRPYAPGQPLSSNTQ